MHLSRAFILAYPTETSAPILNARLDDAIWDILKEFKTPGGLAVAVVRKTAEGTWQLEIKGYGNASLAGDKITGNTLFTIGSNSKLFDTLVTGLLISNETLAPRISWTSKIASIIHEWKSMHPVATSESTILDLMSHRTGLPRHDFMAPLYDSAAAVISRLRYLRPSTGFREHTQYNNLMYTDNIFAPLDMHRTTYFYADAVKIGRLLSSILREDANLTEDPFALGTVRALPFWDQSKKGHMASGDGGVISSAHDIVGSLCYLLQVTPHLLMSGFAKAIWLQMLLREGKNQANEPVIPPEVIRKVAIGVTVYTPVAAYPELSPVVYGGGQMRGTYRGFDTLTQSIESWHPLILRTEMIEHSGATPGFFSRITRFPSENLGIAVLSNDESLGAAIMDSVKYRIVDEILQLEVIDWPTRTSSQPGVNLIVLAHALLASDDSCAELPLLLPRVIDPRAPTLIARWDTMATNYMQLTHYSGNRFNVTGLQRNPAEDTEEVWVRKLRGPEAEFAMDGEDGDAIPLLGDNALIVTAVWAPFNVRYYHAWERSVKYSRQIASSARPEVHQVAAMAKNVLVLGGFNLSDMAGSWRVATTDGAEKNLLPRETTAYTPSASPEIASLPQPDLCACCTQSFQQALGAFEDDEIHAISGMPASVITSQAVAMAAAIHRLAAGQMAQAQVMVALMKKENTTSASE
ncbi:beta-lactamase/transpeptidase-like protein [Mycena epipterygia]|nr:beta-lactamase/transpeptidase-like protein [Mycena epipterygia]